MVFVNTPLSVQDVGMLTSCVYLPGPSTQNEAAAGTRAETAAPATLLPDELLRGILCTHRCSTAAVRSVALACCRLSAASADQLSLDLPGFPCQPPPARRSCTGCLPRPHSLASWARVR
jgi:hypothetical protein